MIAPSSLVRATGTLTFSSVIATDVVVVGPDTYTFIATPASAYDVDVGADDTASAANLAAAINKSGGSGYYDTGTSENPAVTATSSGAVVTLISRLPGTLGNGIYMDSPDATITESGVSLGDVVAGVGDLDAALEGLMDEVQLNSEAISLVVHLTARSTD